MRIQATHMNKRELALFPGGETVEDLLYEFLKNRSLSHTALGYIVGKWAKQVSKEKRITPHSARATFISSLIENGEDIYYISQLVNHADVRTTQRYNKMRSLLDR